MRAALLLALPGAPLAQAPLQVTPGWGVVTDPMAQAITPPAEPPNLAPGPLAVPPGLAPPAQPGPAPDPAILDAPSDPDLLDGTPDRGPEMPRRTIPF